MTAWTIWNRWNALKFRRSAISVTNIIPRAGSLLQEFVTAQEVPEKPPSLAVATQWHPPDYPYYKANFDTGVFKASSSAGIGVIIRDNRGEAIGALSVPTPALLQLQLWKRCHVEGQSSSLRKLDSDKFSSKEILQWSFRLSSKAIQRHRSTETS